MRRTIPTEIEKRKISREGVKSPDGVVSSMPPSKEPEGSLPSFPAKNFDDVLSSFHLGNLNPADPSAVRRGIPQFPKSYTSIGSPTLNQSVNSVQPANLLAPTLTHQKDPSKAASFIPRPMPSISYDISSQVPLDPYTLNPIDERLTLNNSLCLEVDNGFSNLRDRRTQELNFRDHYLRDRKPSYVNYRSNPQDPFLNPLKTNNASRIPTPSTAKSCNTSKCLNLGVPCMNNAPQPQIPGVPYSINAQSIPIPGFSYSRNPSPPQISDVPYPINAPSIPTPGVHSMRDCSQPPLFNDLNGGDARLASIIEKVFQRSSQTGNSPMFSGSDIPKPCMVNSQVRQMDFQTGGGTFDRSEQGTYHSPILKPLLLDSMAANYMAKYEESRKQTIYINSIGSLEKNLKESLEELRLRSRLSSGLFRFSIAPNANLMGNSFPSSPSTNQRSTIGMDIKIEYILLFGGVLLLLPNRQLVGAVILLVVLSMKLYNLLTII